MYAVYAVEVAQTVLLCNSLFRSFVYGFFDENSLDQIGDLWFSIPVLGGLGELTHWAYTAWLPKTHVELSFVPRSAFLRIQNRCIRENLEELWG